MVKPQFSKLMTRVRFPSPPPENKESPVIWPGIPSLTRPAFRGWRPECVSGPAAAPFIVQLWGVLRRNTRHNCHMDLGSAVRADSHLRQLGKSGASSWRGGSCGHSRGVNDHKTPWPLTRKSPSCRAASRINAGPGRRSAWRASVPWQAGWADCASWNVCP